MSDYTTSDNPDVLASTGVNDPNSPWSSLLYTALNSGVSAGTKALNNALADQTSVTGTGASNGAPAAVAAPATAAAAAKSYLPWILGGLAVLVVGWFLFHHD